MNNRRVIDWSIVQTGDDTYDLRLGRRTLMHDANRGEVDKRLRRDRIPGQSVYVVTKVDEQMLATNITRRTDRRHRPVATITQPIRKTLFTPLRRR